MGNPKIQLKYSKEFDLQRKVVSHMTATSWKSIPHVSYLYEPDITDFYKEYQTISKNKNTQASKVTFNTIMLKVIIEGLKSAPLLNATITYNYKKVKGTLNVCQDINISVPWTLPDGRMITPIIFNTQNMTLNDLSNEILKLDKKIGNTNIDEMFYRAAVSDTFTELKKFNLSVLLRIFDLNQPGLKGKEKEEYYKISNNDRLTENDLIDGSVTVSNIGSLYKEQKGAFSILEIIPPQIFAVGLSAIQEKPGVYICEDGHKEIGIRKTMPMCLVFDHRAVDFNALVPFLKRLDEFFKYPNEIHSW